MSNIQLGDALCVSIAGEKEQHVGTDRWRRPAKTQVVFDCADICKPRRSDAAAGSWKAVLFQLWTPLACSSLQITSRSTNSEYKYSLIVIYCSTFWENNQKCILQIAAVYFRTTDFDII